MEWLDKFWHRTLGMPFKLSYREYGGRGKVVVLLHGIASDNTFWTPLVQRLERTTDYRIIVPDLLGHGESPTPSYIDYSVDDQVKALRRLLLAVGTPQVVMVGHSMGCLVASRFASQNPTLTSQLLLYEPPLFTTVPGFETRNRRQEFYRRLYEQIAANPTGKLTMARMLARISKNWKRYLETDQTWLPIQKSLRNTIMQQKSYEELKDTTIRTDIVHGRLDVIIPSHNLRRRLANNANITFYKTTDRHRLSAVSVRTLADIIASSARLPDNRKA
ncbi:hypothetical protein BH09PAT4_BH09PAT4_03780 [soil metagenome]